MPTEKSAFSVYQSERRALCEKYGLDVEVEYPFTTELMNMEPEEVY